MPVFSTADGVFSLDGKPMTILSGAIHYFRTHPDQWRDRLEKLKDCGFNTVETYTPGICMKNARQIRFYGHARHRPLPRPRRRRRSDAIVRPARSSARNGSSAVCPPTC
ncbi:MAG: beta-galactosidase [Acutalibacteraceae bacterium]